MADPPFGLIEAKTAESRMDALCRFIEFWLGPRRPDYGEPPEAIARVAVPMPLRRLYEFAGRWPNRNGWHEIEFEVPAFSYQDHLMALHRLKKEDGKVAFLCENQGVWNCLALATGDDSPVWCSGDQMGENEQWFAGEKLICESLSRFLVSFVLQEITPGSRVCLCDEGLEQLFESQKASAIPVWLNGPYVHGAQHNFYLWKHVLVGNVRGWYSFGANREEGVAFLTEHQGPINEIGLIVGTPWMLDISCDGSAFMRYLQGKTDERAEAPPGTFEFAKQRDRLARSGSEHGDYERNPLVFFRRKGQPTVQARQRFVHDEGLVRSLFEHTLRCATKVTGDLKRRFAERWGP